MRLRALSLSLLLVGLAGCASAGPAVAPAPADPAVPAAPANPRIYVTNQDDATVTIIDAERHEVIETVDLRSLGFSSNAKPHHVTAEPDGSFWYVSLIGENRVLKFDAANRLVDQAEFEVPGMLALDLETDRLFVGRSMSAVNPPRRIGIIDRSDMSVEEIPVLFPRPHAIGSNPRSRHVYSASLATNQMATIDPVEEDVAVAVFDAPSRHAGHEEMAGGEHAGMVHTLVDFAVSPDGSTMVGTGEMSGRLLVWDLADPANPRLVRQIEVSPRPWHPVYSPDGRYVWIPSKGNNSITVVDTRSWSVDAVVTGEGMAEPHGAAISPDGRWVFVSNSNTRGEIPGGDGTVVVIDARTREIVEVIPVGGNATGIGTRARP